MWRSNSNKRSGNNKKFTSTKIDTLVGKESIIEGNIVFKGGLHVDGTIKGNVIAEEGTGAMLILSEHGRIEGEVRVPNMVLNGTIAGDVYGSERVELAPQARINGNVYYNLIEMAMGAEVNGSLVHRAEKPQRRAAAHGDEAPPIVPKVEPIAGNS
jgi:cytoskeletal protein CcmA (bactofilin family)